jgi:hypothetical protein
MRLERRKKEEVRKKGRLVTDWVEFGLTFLFFHVNPSIVGRNYILTGETHSYFSRSYEEENQSRVSKSSEGGGERENEAMKDLRLSSFALMVGRSIEAVPQESQKTSRHK